MSLFRNGSGYYDPTAGEAIKETERSMVNRGEYSDGDIVDVIKNNGNQIEMVLLRCHSNYASALALTEMEPKDNIIEIMSKVPMYADAGKVQYVFYDNICGFLKALPDDDFILVKEAVRKALDLGAAPDPIVQTDRKEINRLDAEYRRAAEKTIRLEAQLDLMKELFREK